MHYRSLIFDFDGTLADTFDEGVRIYNELAKEHGLKTVTATEVQELRHMKLTDFVNHMGISRRRVPKLLFHGTRMLKARISSLQLINGIESVIPKLRKQCDHFGILTSNSVENVQLFLKAHGLSDVFTFVSSTSKLTGKSNHLRSIRKAFSMDPEQMIYIGDEIRDVKAAQKARIPIASVSWGFNSADSLADADPDYLLHHPSELQGLVS